MHWRMSHLQVERQRVQALLCTRPRRWRLSQVLPRSIQFVPSRIFFLCGLVTRAQAQHHQNLYVAQFGSRARPRSALVWSNRALLLSRHMSSQFLVLAFSPLKFTRFKQICHKSVKFARIAPFLNKPADEYTYMPIVRVKENEPFEVAMRRFKRTVEKTGLLTELRAREFYEKPTSERKRKHAAAVKRHHKRIRSQTLPQKMY